MPTESQPSLILLRPLCLEIRERIEKEYPLVISTSYSFPTHSSLRTSDLTIESTASKKVLKSISVGSSSVDSPEEPLRLVELLNFGSIGVVVCSGFLGLRFELVSRLFRFDLGRVPAGGLAGGADRFLRRTLGSCEYKVSAMFLNISLK